MEETSKKPLSLAEIVAIESLDRQPATRGLDVGAIRAYPAFDSRTR